MERVNLKSGRIVYNEFSINFSKSFSDQMECLSEDLLQIVFPHDYLLDIGWYPEFDARGEFIIQVIRNANWESPIYKVSCKNQEDLIHSFNQAIEIVENLI